MKELEDKDGAAKFEQKYKLEGLSESTREEKLHPWGRYCRLSDD